jgi:hypothetical protein
MLTTPRKASAPYSDEAGPRTISTRSIAEIGMSSGPSALPPVEANETEWPSMSTLMTLLSAYRPPELPRTATLGVMWSSTM